MQLKHKSTAQIAAIRKPSAYQAILSSYWSIGQQQQQQPTQLLPLRALAGSAGSFLVSFLLAGGR